LFFSLSLILVHVWISVAQILQYKYDLFFISLWVGIIELLVDVVDPSSGGFLSVLEFNFLFLGEGLEETSLLGNSIVSLLLVGSLGFSLCLSDDSRVGVQGFEGLLVLEWVGFMFVSRFVFSGSSNDRLNFVGVYDFSNIGVGNNSSVEFISDLFSGGDSEGTEDLVQSGEGRFGPDDESTEMASGSKLLKVQSVNVGNINSWDVSDGLDEVDVFVSVDDEGSSSDLGSLVSEFSDSGSHRDGISDSLDIIESSDSLQESEGILGLFNAFSFIINNKG